VWDLGPIAANAVIEMSRNRWFERRAREEVERIKAQEAAEEEHGQARMRELTEQARERREAEAAEERRRKDERDAKLRRSQNERLKTRSGWPGIAPGSGGSLVAARRRSSIESGR